MTYVRPHVRRDGTHVKGHYRRTRPRTATMGTTPRHTSVPPGPFHTGPTTYVRPYCRADGTRVRGHHRSITPRTVAVAAGAGTGLLVLLFILLALASGPGNTSRPASTTTHSPAAPAHHR